MLRLTLAQMRRSTGRLLAGAVAIVVGTAFIAATLLGSALIRDTSHAAMTASIGHADVVVTSDGAALGPDDLDAVRRTPGVAVADGVLDVPTFLESAGRSDYTLVRATPSPGLEPVELTEGAFPSGPGEVVMTEGSMKRLELELGDEVSTAPQIYLGADAGLVEVDAEPLEVVGVVGDPVAIFAPSTVAVVAPAQITEWLDLAGAKVVHSQVLALAEDGTSADELAETLTRALTATNPDVQVQTGDDVADALTAELAGTTVVFTVLILAFAAVAMFVAAIVITNTFQVLVAQRTHTLALLRCVGATKAQIRRSVLVEALLLGVLSGIGGLVVGTGLGQAALWFLGRQDLGLELPETVHVTAAVVLAPVLTGAVVTVLAALSPARAATRVAPLAALRPAAAPDARGRSRGRLVLATVTVVLGVVALVGGVVLGSSDTVDADIALQGGFALGVLGGIVSFAGVMIGAVFVVPPVVRALGALASRAGDGGTARLATANAVRNPRRTAATATALIIGVGLVTMMSTGAVSVRASLDSLLDSEFPTDVVVRSTGWDDSGQLPLTDAQLDAVTTAPGVTATAAGRSAAIVLGEGGYLETEALAFDPEELAPVLRHGDMLDGVEPGTVALAGYLQRELGVEPGAEIPVAPAGVPGAVESTVRVVAASPEGPDVLMPVETLEALAPELQTTTLYVRLGGPGDEHAALIAGIQDRLTDVGAASPDDAAVSAPYVIGPAAERAVYDQVIDTLLAVVVGLLAVAVVIALIGVANTLSLSVIERRRESAVLRAVGLTRGQLRGMLAVEGVLLALVGVLLGAVLGLTYGWAGTAIVLGQMGDVTLAVPWAHLAAVAGVAVLAGLLASVLPARSAVRTPPVAALAAE